MTAHIKKHWGGYLLALVIGLVSLLPQFFAIAELGDAYQGVWPIHGADDVYYGARAQDIVDGHPRLSNPYLAEHKTGEPLQFWIPDYVVTAPLHALGVPVDSLHYVFDFILPLILALLSYWVAWLLTKNKWLSFGMAAVFNGGLFLGLFNRPVSPQLVFVFVLAAIGFAVQYIKTKQPKWLVLTALNTGFLFYAYTYYWTFFVVVFGLFALWALIAYRKEFPVWKLISAWVAGAVIGIPYFVQLVSSRSLPGYEDTLTRLGMLQTHFPSGLLIVAIGGVLFVVCAVAWWKKWIDHGPISALMISGVVGSVVVTNHHVITGQNLEFSSHYWPIAAFWFGFTAVYLLQKVRQKWVVALVVLSVLAVLPKAHTAVASQLHMEDREIAWQEYGPVFDWLNEKTPTDSVVFANEEFSMLTPMHTHNNVWFTRWANLHFMTDEEVWERFTINHYWEEFSAKFLKEHERAIWGTAFINADGHAQQQNKLRRLLGVEEKVVDRYPEDKIREFSDFAETVKVQPIEELLNAYQVDYIVWDSKTDLEWSVSELSLEQKAKFKDVYIYELKKD